MTAEDIYNQLTPEQRAAIAQEYLQQFQQNGTGQQFANVNPQNVTAQQLAQMHDHAAKQHPGFLQKLRKHPFLTALAGGIAVYELDKHFNK